mgnify:CR=1 FL=1
MYINNIKHQNSQTGFHNNICYGTYFLACVVKCLTNTSYMRDLMNDMFQMRIHIPPALENIHKSFMSPLELQGNFRILNTHTHIDVSM